MRWLFLFAFACSQGPRPEAPPEAAPAGHFLETPSGQPPVPLPAEAVQVAVSAASQPVAVRAVAQSAFGEAHVFDGEAPGQLVVRGAPVTREALAGLVAAGARGGVLLWYPLRVVRQRLYEGGTAGLWRGILATRDLLTNGSTVPTPSAQAETLFGGTPRLHGFAVSTVDRSLLGDWTPRSTRKHETAPNVLRGPADEAVDLYVSAERLEGPDFDEAIERLVRVTNQGGHVWVVVALALAEPHVPAKF